MHPSHAPGSTTPSPLTLGTKLSYAVGNIGLQMLVAAMNFMLMIFYTDVALVAPAVAGAALLVGKVWDTVNDPLFGWVTDRTRSRWGRHRVYLIYGAIPLGIAAAAVWMVPPGLSPVAAFLWIAITYTVFDTLMTLVQLPYQAMAANMTTDYDERTSLTAYASMGALIGFFAGSVFMPILVRAAPDARTGYALAGSCFGLVAGVAVAVVAWRVREPQGSAAPTAQTDAPADARPMWDSVRETLRTTLRNRPFLLLMSAATLVRLGLTLVQASLAYFVIYQLQGDKGDLPRYMGTLLGVVGLSLFGWKYVVDRWEKNWAYVLGLVLCAGGLVALYWVGPGDQRMVMAILVVIGIGMGAHWIVPFAMVPDTIDHGHMQAGERKTGMYYGLYGLMDKLARTLATVMVAGMLDVTGYVPNVAQSASALQGITLMTGVLPAACLVLAIPLLVAYPITRARHAGILSRMGTS
ncbi:symporter [Acidovorax sp. Leaf76]|uniref:MFS transporter n=1 Tax=unclassified Acidovorax TaxID=2684926 RepID=UPI0006FA9844|nr:MULTISPECIES: MFS transporter [unclassified Acidovorax]KQO26497.1 symporter [Acidovorax sp. Leaf76]KQO40271.1 symporter [Acidovorax sp. Leaf84]KQS42410.1 symporter [Acidovorax sp. Leaf191]